MLDVVRHALHGDPQLARVIERDVQHDVAIVKVSGVLTAVT